MILNEDDPMIPVLISYPTQEKPKKKARKPLDVFGIIVCIAVAALFVLVVLIYIFRWNVPGLTGKNLWDWLQLLIIPAVLAVGGIWFNYATGITESEIASDRQCGEALQAYIDSMSELLLDKDNPLRKSGEDDEVRTIARVRTLTVLPRLDGLRKGSVLQFLHESGLIEIGKGIVDLLRADLRQADLHQVDLSRADLRGADLRQAALWGIILNQANLHKAGLIRADVRGTLLIEADLSGADLRHAFLYHTYMIRANLTQALLEGADLGLAQLYEADLSGANLSEAKLRFADLHRADLSGAGLGGADLTRANLSEANLSGAYLAEANLTGANVTPEQWSKAKSLEGTIMPNGRKRH